MQRGDLPKAWQGLEDQLSRRASPGRRPVLQKARSQGIGKPVLCHGPLPNMLHISPFLIQDSASVSVWQTFNYTEKLDSKEVLIN